MMVSHRNTGSGFSLRLLHRHLKIFFIDALRISLSSPSQAYFFYRTIRRQQRAARIRSRWKEKGVHVPPIIIFSITTRCNLQCRNCYAQALHPPSSNELRDEEIWSILAEAREMGVSFFVIAGGEPFMRKKFLGITKDFPEILFLVFTNGLLIDKTILSELSKQKNVIPLISLEGYEEETDLRRGEGVYGRLEEIIGRVRSRGIFFGTSLTVTRSTFRALTDERFVQNLVDERCKFFLFLEYTPIMEGTEDLVLTGEQRERLMLLMDAFHSRWPALFIAVPGHEAAVGGCLAAGRGFVHISAEGDLEPCPFAPFSDANLRDSSLKEALGSDLLKVLRQHPEQLRITDGGCCLWKRREWVKSLLRERTKRKDIAEMRRERGA